MWFLKTGQIIKSIQTLRKCKFNKNKELFYILILKYAGISASMPINIDSEEIKEKLVAGTVLLSYTRQKKSEPEINEKKTMYMPIGVEKQPVTEPIKKWARGRLKNNILGGGVQWRDLIYSIPSTNEILLRPDYLDKIIVDGSDKIPIGPLVIWIYRYHKFEKEIKIKDLILRFKADFKITQDEYDKLFSEDKLDVELSEDIPNEYAILQEIRNPSESVPEDIQIKISIDTEYAKELDLFNEEGVDLIMRDIDINIVEEVLEDTKQIILSGVPGTSKSHTVNKLAEEFSYHLRRVQFHPQYTYQDFIIGKTITNGDVSTEKGYLLNLIDEAISNPDKKYLLAIEEFNRANVSQVFGEAIQLLDRGEQLQLRIGTTESKYELPDNLFIIATMNSSDRTLGKIDFALRRRFYQLSFPINYDLIRDQVTITNEPEVKINEFLKKLNDKISKNLNDKNMQIGHAIFLKKFVQNGDNWEWPLNKFELLFHGVIVPLITEFCNGNQAQISNILGTKYSQYDANEIDFVDFLKDYE